eukprot:GEMP01056522.1.p1 GENE.GEMP01056522.1~~GEMP01056522.1.p1  ORF type:complete len:159 (+),score=28.12 GEMP01056522.1:71-547(+)
MERGRRASTAGSGVKRKRSNTYLRLPRQAAARPPSRHRIHGFGLLRPYIFQQESNTPLHFDEKKTKGLPSPLMKTPSAPQLTRNTRTIMHSDAPFDVDRRVFPDRAARGGGQMVASAMTLARKRTLQVIMPDVPFYSLSISAGPCDDDEDYADSELIE